MRQNTQEAAEINMRSKSTALFGKQRTCPPAESILLRGQAVAEHVAACEFCGAEAQFLSRFPPSPTKYALPFVAFSLPRPLRRLAEELMSEASLNRARFAEAVYEAERLMTYTDA